MNGLELDMHSVSLVQSRLDDENLVQWPAEMGAYLLGELGRLVQRFAGSAWTTTKNLALRKAGSA
jgi:hypothetical protein